MRKIFGFLLLFSMFTLHTNQAVQGQTLKLTKEEQQYIKEHPTVTIGVDSEFVPFEFFDDDGEYKGITAELLEKVEEKTGLTFEIQEDLTWPEAYEKALAGEIDALSAVGYTGERSDHFLLSQPYHHFKRVIVKNIQDTNVMNIQDLEGAVVAVQKNSSHHSYVKDQAKIHLSLYDTAEAALVAVSTGEEKYYIGNLATSKYIINTHGISDLRTIAFESDKRQGVHFAVQKDSPELLSIFNKALASIPEAELNAIKNKWVALDTDKDYTFILRFAAGVTLVLLIIISVSTYWNFRLRKEMKVRKAAEHSLVKANEKADQINIELRIANEELEKMSMMDGLTEVFNRRYLDNFMIALLSEEMGEKFPIGVMMIDIDYFKKLNDRFGHSIGDMCLKKVAKSIDQTIKREEGFVSRYGGEEFAVLLLRTNEEEVLKIAEAIRRQIEKLDLSVNDSEISVTVSIGTSVLSDPLLLKEKNLLDIADQALYQAKASGRNKVIYLES